MLSCKGAFKAHKLTEKVEIVVGAGWEAREQKYKKPFGEFYL
jgi:hypothetical protein